MSDTTARTTHEFAAIVSRLHLEFDGVHAEATVARCVKAAHHSAEDVTGRATPDLVERIARKHLHVLAMAFANHP